MKGASDQNEDLRALIRTIPDFPKPGIMFRDVTSLLADAAGLRATVARMAAPWEDKGIDKVIGLEARGFILGGAVAYHLGAGFVPVRKAGKLPGKVVTQDYALEYGSATFELHEDSIAPGETVLIVDDLLATGGTAEAGITLLERLGACIAACSFVVDLPDLGGAARLRALGMDVHTLVAFDGD
ncbi:adenine phosphoribosyltransferase [Roseovarius nanhaiticus]|uniref:adenine phosphoribosyltransferase n=1 Tax=Roseovarius nanhaiticus TaxID=573024 RepID=UPI002493562E|nr:adenine phosphoribosyltransferase [Roseovarius nanhaiticus]